MRFASALTVGALAYGAAAGDNYLGFNTGSTNADNSPKFKADFVAEFSAAQKLQNAPGTFNAARLYTNVQAGSTNDPIEAFDAAIQTNTVLLLGIWASGTDNIDNEISALQKGLSQFGDKLAKQVIGISIGSEDLYRNGVTGTTNKAGIGADPSVVAGFIKDFKDAFKNSPLKSVPIGHVDTWDAWTNSSNKAVLDAVDWLGVDEYPYYETGKGNTIDNALNLFNSAYDATMGVANGKPVWVTETGWPVSGIKWDQAVPSIKNAKYYWDNIGCRLLFNKTPTFWYTLSDTNSVNKQSFGITKDLSTTPLFDLTCPKHFPDPNKGAATSSAGSSSSKTTMTTAGATGKPTKSSGSSPSNTQSGASAATSTGAASIHELSIAAYAGLAGVAGIFAMF